VFATACGHYALRAFGAHAIIYLLPVSRAGYVRLSKLLGLPAEAGSHRPRSDFRPKPEATGHCADFRLKPEAAGPR
jgi:hypothetical protein